MKIILLKDVKGIGRKNDVKNVSDGYARNFLLKNSLCKAVAENEVKELENRKIIGEKEAEKAKAELKDFAKKISGKKFIFHPKIGKNNEIFSSIKIDDIEKELAKEMPKELANKSKIKIDLEKPLKSLGNYEINVSFGFGINSKINIALEKQA